MLIIWGAGMIGRAIAHEAHSMYQVIVVDTDPQAASFLPDDIPFYLPNDIQASGLLRRANVLIWSAGVLAPTIAHDNSAVNIVEGYLSELLASKSLASDLHLILVSSFAVYGNSSGPSEATPAEPVTEYGLHKAQIEILAREWAQTREAKLTVVRSCGVVGPLNEPGGGWMQASLRKFVFSNGSDQRAFKPIQGQEILHARDLARAILKIAGNSDVATQILNIGSGVIAPNSLAENSRAGLNWSKAASVLGYRPKFRTFRQIMEDIMSSSQVTSEPQADHIHHTGRRTMILSGSHRIGWYTTAIANEVARQLTAVGQDVDLIEVSRFNLPMHNPDDHKHPHASEDLRVRAFAERVQQTDSFVWITPIYHGSYSSRLKHVIDHLNINLLQNKPIVIIVHGGGRFHGSAVDHLRAVGINLHATVINTAVATNVTDFSEDDSGPVLENHEIRSRIARAVKEIVNYRTEPS